MITHSHPSPQGEILEIPGPGGTPETPETPDLEIEEILGIQETREILGVAEAPLLALRMEWLQWI